MAGGKETPRQKLIGLMYLVLLALLALQVSGEIMVKFYFLDQSLAKASEEAIIRNKAQLASIQKVGNERKTEDALNKVKLAEELRKESESLTKYIADIREELIKATEGRDETGFYVGAKEEDKVAILMVGNEETGIKGKGSELKEKLDAYYKKVLDIAKRADFKDAEKEITPLALDAKDDPLLKDNEDQKNKNFVELNFAHTPMVAAMAVLAEKMNKVANYESLIMGHINPEGQTFKVDELFATFNAEAKVVAAGTKYIARVFMAGRNKNMKPKMTFEGRPMEVDAEGFGKIEFTATGGAFDADGNMKKNWTAKVMAPGPDGAEKTYEVKGEYIVAKPVIDIKSTAVSALYLGCANPLQINVPALGANYNPSFNVSNADYKKGAGKGEVVIIPKSKNKVKIGVSSDGNFIGDRDFDVKDIPNPVVELVTGKGPINPVVGEKASLTGVRINIIPDKGFAEALPKEANYTITKGIVRLIRGKDVVGGNKPINNPTIIFSQLGYNIRPGDQISVEIQELSRTNSQGDKFPVKLLPSASFQQFRITD